MIKQLRVGPRGRVPHKIVVRHQNAQCRRRQPSCRIIERVGDGQIAFYLDFPAAMLGCAVAVYGISRFTQFKKISFGAELAILFIVFLFMIRYTGGI